MPVPAAEFVAAYDVAGFRMRVALEPEAGPRDEILAPIERLLGRFRIRDPRARRGWSLSIGRREAQPAQATEGMRRVWEGASPAGFRVVNWVAKERRRSDMSGVGTLEVDLAGRHISVALLPGAATLSVHYFLTAILHDGLTDAGHCVVHAACLVRGTRHGPRALLIVAKSGTGKSTAALAMTAGGWQLMGDDIAVITRRADGLFVWGFPRFCNVRRPTLALLPWLTELPLVPTTVPETFALPLEHLGGRVCQGAPQPAPPAAVICLERHNSDGHRLLPLDRAAALMHVAEENVQPIEGAEDALASRSFATIAELVRTTPTFSLSAGPQLDALGLAIGEQLSL